MIHTFPDHESLSREAARQIIRIGRRSVAERGRFDLVLAGGKTPNRTYEILAETTQIEGHLWQNAHVFWGDERYVPPDHPQSNCGAARLVLLDRLGIPPDQIHRIPTEGRDPYQAAESYDSIFPHRPDLLLLGIGEDGHTASLFPGSPALDESTKRFVVAHGPVEPRLRITITPLAIAAARTILVLVSGANKADAVRRVFDKDGNIRETPARLVRGATWMITADAARGLAANNEGFVDP